MRITLLTDFGDRDGFVGAMKGVIACRAPNVVVVDLAHNVPAGDIRHASHLLFTTAPFFPPGTCHVVVVDPGVGTERRAVAVAVDDQIYVAPDNGVLTDVLQAAAGRVMGVVLDKPAFWQHPISSTFHGRDIFAPVAAHIASGVPISAVGTTLDPDTLLRLHAPEIIASEGQVAGEVTYIDSFGNATTNLARKHLAEITTEVGRLEVQIGEGRCCPLEHTYASVPEGDPVAVIGSCGRMEIAINGGSAAQLLTLIPGSPIRVRSR
ncbi:MAG: SAM-dependent chlorinase/fluorinase [Armatimonadetes bacterium]|nr:SAM-dependent chlorinase/fluorinase [Armatimonadota bacterium]